MIETQEGPVGTWPTPALMEHVRAQHHETQHRALPELIALAQRVETEHAVDPDAPHGLTQALRRLSAALENHLQHEEPVLSTAQAIGISAGSTARLEQLRKEHVGLEANMNRIAATTHGFRLPRHADATRTRLYVGAGKLIEDLDAQMFLENEVLFPRLETVA
ncbi:MAG: hemerythrin domain-containing protein [Allgaiera sp.]|jgi:regulator of cell morphogenesis and NO signaling|nr:hemerythrin domain-containing protein [Allgaiera sp.]